MFLLVLFVKINLFLCEIYFKRKLFQSFDGQGDKNPFDIPSDKWNYWDFDRWKLTGNDFSIKCKGKGNNLAETFTIRYK